MIILCCMHNLPKAYYFEYIIFKEKIMSCSMKTIMKSELKFKIGKYLILVFTDYAQCNIMRNFLAGKNLILLDA